VLSVAIKGGYGVLVTCLWIGCTAGYRLRLLAWEIVAEERRPATVTARIGCCRNRYRSAAVNSVAPASERSRPVLAHKTRMTLANVEENSLHTAVMMQHGARRRLAGSAAEEGLEHCVDVAIARPQERLDLRDVVEAHVQEACKGLVVPLVGATSSCTYMRGCIRG
jgi:hypothetical protein